MTDKKDVEVEELEEVCVCPACQIDLISQRVQEAEAIKRELIERVIKNIAKLNKVVTSMDCQLTEKSVYNTAIDEAIAILNDELGRK